MANDRAFALVADAGTLPTWKQIKQAREQLALAHAYPGRRPLRRELFYYAFAAHPLEVAAQGKCQ